MLLLKAMAVTDMTDKAFFFLIVNKERKSWTETLKKSTHFKCMQVMVGRQDFQVVEMVAIWQLAFWSQKTSAISSDGPPELILIFPSLTHD